MIVYQILIRYVGVQAGEPKKGGEEREKRTGAAKKRIGGHAPTHPRTPTTHGGTGARTRHVRTLKIKTLVEGVRTHT